jgi:hypothetical protein
MNLYFFQGCLLLRLPKKFNVQLGQKVPFVLARFQVSAPPRLENPDSDKKDAFFGLDTQITILGTLNENDNFTYSQADEK